MQKCECVVMEFGYKFCGISAASKYVCVGEWRLTFGVFERCAIFPLTSVDVDSRNDF